MQTPTGYRIDADGAYHAASWLAVIFNPSFPYRFAHMMLASTLTVAFLLSGLAAWQLLRGVAGALGAEGAARRPDRSPRSPRRCRSSPATCTASTRSSTSRRRSRARGDLGDRARRVAAPVRLAVGEGPCQPLRGGGAGTGSWVLTHSAQGEIKGLNSFRDHPPVAPLFFAFRIMVGIGVLMLLAGWAGLWLYRRARWDAQALPRRFLQLLAAMTFAGWLATVCGWYITRSAASRGIVFGLVRTADVVSKTPAPLIAVTLALYVTLYLALINRLRDGAEVHGREARGGARRRGERAAVTPPGIATAPSAVAGPSR
jgi:cytochrome d ubiquinol oxidase subunit I